ncbi:MAG: hypothetical protein H6661_07390 [Ardenticatenaceae bacterium]|nr:hypothetical protein [Ardenticatenaceae bacterium]
MGTKSDEYQVTRQDVADILAGTPQPLTEHGPAGAWLAAAKPECAAGC